MSLRNKIALFTLFISIICVGQNKVCTSDANEYQDLNTIGKCAIDNFKKSNTKEFLQVSSRSRYVRKRSNVHLANFKKNIKAVSNFRKVKKVAVVEAKKETSAGVKVNNTVDAASGEVVLKNYLRFDQVFKAPIFITCHTTSDDVKDECNKETISGIILENLVYPFDAAANGISGEVWVRFIIDQDGFVTNVTTKGPENGAELEKEAERLVKLLPKFMPGKHDGKYVNVEYFMPISFHLDEEE